MTSVTATLASLVQVSGIALTHINLWWQQVSWRLLARFGISMQHNLVDAMKEGMRRLPSAVSVISVQNANQERFAMTVSSVTSVSDAPASLLVCVNQSAQICRELIQGQSFVVNVLTQAQQDVSIQCSIGAKGAARFAVGHWSYSSSAPLLLDAEVNFICTVDAILAYGTHHIVVGKITDVRIAKSDLDPLLYVNGGYQKIEF